VVSPPPHVVSPEVFREKVEAEILRYNRYLQPIGLLRIGPRTRHADTTALGECVETEIRQTDTASLLPDGSYALLALHAGERQLRTIARRLMDAAAEIELERGEEPTDLIATFLGIRDRRVEAQLVWLSLCRAFENCRTGGDTIVCVR
jgi:hypothetical protein